MDFPAGTAVGSALVVEAIGIGPGTLAASAGEVLTYTVTNAVNVPALTNIRIQISNINNPPTPSASLTVGITTRNAANTVIDGTTATAAYNMVQVGNTQIAPGAVTTTKIATGAVTATDIADGAITKTKPANNFMKTVNIFDTPPGHAVGRNPDGVATVFEIVENVGSDSTVFINIDNTFSADPVCSVSQAYDDQIEIECTFAPADGSFISYTVVNLPVESIG
jgi:hypothetical protein